MADSILLNYMFKTEPDQGSVSAADLTRKAKRARMREILRIVRRHNVLQGLTPETFRAMLEDLGPSFVKIGQTLSTRSEILPQEFCDELTKLQTESDPMPFDTVLAELKRQFGEERFAEVFADIDEKPLGSASLAQVHRARLTTGDVVAVKVQRPGVRVKMAQDISIIRMFAKRATYVMPHDQMLNPNDVVDELWDMFVEETDFKREAANLVEFARLNEDVKYISCPKVYPEYSNENVLVMEYIEGIPIFNKKALLEAGYDLHDIGVKLLDNYATQILDHGFFHADPHPGNIIIREGQIVYIDLGFMGRLSARDRVGFTNIIHAVCIQSSSELKDALISFAVQKDNAAIDHTRFLADLDLLLGEYGSIDVGDLDIGLFLQDIFALTRMSKVTLPASITSVSRGIVTIEGTIAPFIQQDNIVNIINDHIKRGTNTQEKVRDSLEDAVLALRQDVKGVSDALGNTGELMRMLTRGQLKVNMNMLGSNELIGGLSIIMNRLSMAIIIAGLFIGSSLMVFIKSDVFTILGVPVLSFFGYLGAFILSVYVVFDIFRRG